MSGLRAISAPFVAAAPAGARVRTRLRASDQDARVLAAVGAHLGSLASADLAARVREGRLDKAGRAASRRERKRALTASSSSRWAGAITRTTDDLQALAERNLLAERASLRARTRQIGARLAVPAGGRHGRARGYATQAERWRKQQRLQRLRSRAAAVERRLERGHMGVCRGGGRLAKARHNLNSAGLTQAGWRTRWEARRWFITADGEAGKAWGNETIRWHPGEGWLKLPAPLAHLGNRPHDRYRLTCQVSFPHRGDEATAQAASANRKGRPRKAQRQPHPRHQTNGHPRPTRQPRTVRGRPLTRYPLPLSDQERCGLLISVLPMATPVTQGRRHYDQQRWGHRPACRDDRGYRAAR